MATAALPKPAKRIPPKPTDPPLLVAILIGAMKSGDKLLKSLAREWLADQGIHITFAKDAPALQPKAVANG